MGDVIQGVRGNEDRLRAMVQTNLVEMHQAWQVIEANLRALIAACAQEFQNYRGEATTLLYSLQQKFQAMDAAVG